MTLIFKKNERKEVIQENVLDTLNMVLGRVKTFLQRFEKYFCPQKPGFLLKSRVSQKFQT